jgi:hypothetical protein
MINSDQIRAAEQGATIRVQAGVELVLIRADYYDQLLANADDPTPTYPAILEALADEDPDQYLEYLNETR